MDREENSTEQIKELNAGMPELVDGFRLGRMWVVSRDTRGGSYPPPRTIKTICMDILRDRYRTNLRHLRMVKGLTCAQLSLELGMAQQRIGNIENGVTNAMANAEEMNNISAFFNVSIDDMCHKVAVLKFEYPKEEGE